MVAHARVTPAELAAWNAKASAAGVTLSELLRQAMSRTQTWTAPAMEVERERTRQVARIGSNLNQIARWANTHLDELAPVEVIAHLVAIKRALARLGVGGARAMLIKFIARGTGSAAAAAAYLTRETDSQGNERADVSVLRGDPDQVAAVSDALEFEQKYTSAVIAWAAGGPAERHGDRPGARRVRGHGLARSGAGSLRLDGGAALTRPPWWCQFL